MIQKRLNGFKKAAESGHVRAMNAWGGFTIQARVFREFGTNCGILYFGREKVILSTRVVGLIYENLGNRRQCGNMVQKSLRKGDQNASDLLKRLQNKNLLQPFAQDHGFDPGSPYDQKVTTYDEPEPFGG